MEAGAVVNIAGGDYEIVEGVERVDFERVHAWLAASYWTPGVARETVERAARNSALVIGVLGRDGRQAAFGRIVSDKTRFAYLSDFIVDDAHRGKGLGQAMVRFALEHPEFATVTNWCLMTLDAHGVYEKLGFKRITDAECLTERWMARIRKRNLSAINP